jgi:O-methyltransferase
MASDPSPSLPPVMMPVENRLADAYLEVTKRCLMRGSYRAPSRVEGRNRWFLYAAVARVVKLFGFELVRRVDPKEREEGRNFTSDADTMVGSLRLDNLQACVVDVLRDGVPGDLIETGVWRGGASIFMRSVLNAYGISDRTVWLADSFQGLPKPDPVRYPLDEGLDFHLHPILAVSLEDVQASFERYGLLDDQVVFLKGWFKDTLPGLSSRTMSVIRLDGDLYESTMDALTALYPRLSVGGYVIVDDYGAMESCRKAVDDFRAHHGITEPIQRIDWTGVFWRRTG